MIYGLKVYDQTKIDKTKPIEKCNGELGCECPVCGHRVASGDKQCTWCGQKFKVY